ncbi:Uncharacterised protein [Legionella wadsworthii]|uniref:Uncharacterized protein n=1 Tax=Legionella wadsworthii TaxID=28088 RepID=A0A378LVJ9_9GAMM|nr:hypothetical protein [Legionella wadsworthii]STY29869.1 Uncharacterised protein [Legionella wadsworthii]
MPKVKGSKTGKIVTASFDVLNKKDNSKSRFPSLKTTKDLVLLSIRGNEYCSNEYLAATVQQSVSLHQTAPDYEGPKGKTTFLIADEIYWHNLKALERNDEEALKREALRIGEEYFEKNLAAFLTPLDMRVPEFKLKYPNASMDEQIAIINQLATEKGKNFEIVRWHTWVSQHQFDKTIKEIMPFYQSVEGLKVAIDKTVHDFVSRHSKDGVDSALWAERSRGYLTEESPAIMLLAAMLNYNFIIYPGEILPSFEATKEYFIVEPHVARIQKGISIKDDCAHNRFSFHTESPSRLVNWLEVNFRRMDELKDKNTKVSHSSATLFAAPKKEKETETEKGKEKKEAKEEELPPELKSIKKEEGIEVVEGELVSGEELVLGSIIQGISKALERALLDSKSSTSKPGTKTLATYPPASLMAKSELSQIFEGITEGVLGSDLSNAEKLGFMTGLINTYLSQIKDTKTTTNTSSHDFKPPAMSYV